MSEFISNKHRKARKARQCFFCGGIIKKGEVYDSTAMTDGDSVFRLDSHLDCEELIRLLGIKGEDGVTRRDFGESIDGYIREHHEDDESWFNLSWHESVQMILKENKNK